MLLERSDLQVREGMEAEFASTMAETGIPLLKSFDGVGRVEMGRGVENPGKFMLLVEWQSMEAHKAFNAHPRYPDFRAVLAPYLTGGAMEHFDMA
jgi:heme-degrading monooxygenase HmoA